MDKQCNLCNKSFSYFFSSKSRCARCRLIVCTECNRTGCKISQGIFKPMKTERICILCKQDAFYQQEFIQQIKPSWNKTCGFQEVIQDLEINSNYKAYKEEFLKSKKGKIQEEITRDLINGIISNEYFNYSFQDWMCQSLAKNKKEKIFEDVINLVGTFMLKNQSIGYSRQLFQIAVVFLTLTNEFSAYGLLERIYKLMPTEYWPSQTVSLESVEINQQLSEFQQVFKIDTIQIPIVKKFIECFWVECIQSLFINMVSFSCFYTILVDLLRSSNFNEIGHYVKVIAKINIKHLDKVGIADSYQRLQTEILRRTDFKMLQQVKEYLNQILQGQECSSPRSVIRLPSQSQFSEYNPSKSQSCISIAQDEEGDFEQQIKCEQNAKIQTLNLMILDKQKELEKLKAINAELKGETKPIDMLTHHNYYKLTTGIFKEVADQLDICLQSFK